MVIDPFQKEMVDFVDLYEHQVDVLVVDGSVDPFEEGVHYLYVGILVDVGV